MVAVVPSRYGNRLAYGHARINCDVIFREDSAAASCRFGSASRRRSCWSPLGGGRRPLVFPDLETWRDRKRRIDFTFFRDMS